MHGFAIKIHDCQGYLTDILYTVYNIYTVYILYSVFTINIGIRGKKNLLKSSRGKILVTTKTFLGLYTRILVDDTFYQAVN